MIKRGAKMGTYILGKKMAVGFLDNAREIIALATLFFIGLIVGTVVSVRLSEIQSGSVSEYMDCFFSAYTLQGADKGNVFKVSVLSNIKCLLMMCLPLFSAWLLPFLLAQIALKGFKIGFSVGFLTNVYGAFGVAVGFFSLFWHILFTLPILVLCGAKIMSFSLGLGGSIKGFSRFKSVNSRVYINLVGILLTAVLIIVLGGLFDGYAVTAITLSLCGILFI